MKKCCRCRKIKPKIDFFKGHWYCKKCDNISSAEWNKQVRIEKPWWVTLFYIKRRCNNPNNNRYNLYGGRGIKCLITEEELKVLWFRDKAFKMKIPTIDREDNDGNYTFGNCKYIEKSDNSKKMWLNRKNKLKREEV